MKLIYPLFPLLGQGNSPQWCSDVVKSADSRGDVVYDIRVAFRQQGQALLDLLGARTLRPSRVRRLRALLGPLEAQDLADPLNEQHVRVFDADHFGISVVARDLYVLARADVVVVDANTAGYGEHMVTATYAHLLGCRVIVVNDRHLLPPFLGEIASSVVSSTKVTNLLGPRRRARPAAAIVPHAVDPFDDGTG